MSRRIVWTWKQAQNLEGTKAVYVAIEFGKFVIRWVWVFVSILYWMLLALSLSLKITTKQYKELVSG